MAIELGAFFLDLNMNIHILLGEHTSMFQCVVLTESAVVVHMLMVNDYDIRLLSNSVTILKALGNNKTTN